MFYFANFLFDPNKTVCEEYKRKKSNNNPRRNRIATGIGTLLLSREAYSSTCNCTKTLTAD